MIKMLTITLFLMFQIGSGKYSFGWNEEANTNAKYMTQVQDHFSYTNQNVWQQAYFVNADYYSGDSSAPVFIYIGGEGPLGSSSVTNNFVVDVLPRYNGLLLALEHRYYGCHNASSCPYTFDSPEDGHLQYCTSEQALADLSSFHDFATAEYGIPSGAKWIAIGGSYPGMLAGFLRALYPDQFAMAVASSAPVNGILDMQTFQNIVTNAYTMDVPGIGGSPQCASAIAKAHDVVGNLLQTVAGRVQLANLFPSLVPNAAWLRDPDNQRTFAGCGVASFPAQSNKPTCSTPGCGITQICQIMTNSSEIDPLKRLALLVAAQNEGGYKMTSACEMDWQAPGDIPIADENYWGYQTCNEFGFYQTCEAGTKCFYTQGLVSFANPTHRPNDFCTEQFNISTSQTQERIIQTNQYYKKKVGLSSRIIWVNGDVDPWHGQGYLESPGSDQPVIFPVVGAAHCAWMRAANRGDQPSLVKARTQIWTQIDEWLASSQ